MIASIAHTVGSIFQPVFHLFGWLLAFFYGLIPNYAVAITLLTIVIMGVLTPFTIKSTQVDEPRCRASSPRSRSFSRSTRDPRTARSSTRS